MKKRTKGQMTIIKWLMLIFCLIATVYMAQSSLSYTNAPIKAAKKTELGSGQIKISKTAEPVTGMVNQWDITLRIEGRNQFPPPPTDIVLIIDTSGSMKDYDRMTKAKTAAEKFVNMILRKDYANRISLITYGTEVTKYTFNEGEWSGQFADSMHKNALLDTIKSLKPEGGTFTQAAIKSATEVIMNASGEKRNIVLISDGVPTFSYPPTEPYNRLFGMQKYTVKNGYNYYETVKTIPKEKFNYNKPTGNGAEGTYRYSGLPPDYEQMPPNSKNRLMSNHAHSAIAEAAITKNEKRSNGENLVTDFYTIGVDMDLNSSDDGIVTGNKTLKEIASSEDKSFAATADNLEDILGGIAGEIVGAIKSGFVVDPMGVGFEMVGSVQSTQGTTEVKEVTGRPTINWNVGALKTPVSLEPDEDVMFAEIKYRVNADDNVLKPNIIDKNGLAKTNGRTTLVYKDYNDVMQPAEEFIVPKVKPIIVSLQKKLLNEKDEEMDDQTETFDFSYGKDQYTTNDRFSLYSNEVKKMVHPWKADQNYTVEEILQVNQEYETTIDINGVTNTGIKSSFNFTSPVETYEHQQIIVTNKNMPKRKTVVLNIRQTVLNPNSELVIPSKGYYHSRIDETVQNMNLISESTIKDSAVEVSQELFAKYEFTLEKQQEKLKIKDFVPEYYTFFGYIATTTNVDLNVTHLSSNTSALIKNNEAVLDYQQDNEYWVTMFITPDLGKDNDGEPVSSPRPYSWDYKVNKFGS
ncbi:VWA domain-containing protein [Enterococcus plantarum]|nr:VWA domain-containing protein [Enterococcus plantarum]